MNIALCLKKHEFVEHVATVCTMSGSLQFYNLSKQVKYLKENKV